MLHENYQVYQSKQRLWQFNILLVKLLAYPSVQDKTLMGTLAFFEGKSIQKKTGFLSITV